jgi:hypothetical protein
MGGPGDFAFLEGSWVVTNRRLLERLRGCTDWEVFTATASARNMLGGLANVDEIYFPDGTSGMTVRLFDVNRRLWSLYWVSSRTGTLFPPVQGNFTNGIGEFYGDDTHDGTPVRVRFLWSKITSSSARWEQAFSTDGGQTWEINWIMEFARS